MQDESIPNLSNNKSSKKKPVRNEKKKFAMGLVILLIFSVIAVYQGRQLVLGKTQDRAVKGEATSDMPNISLPSSEELRSGIEQRVGDLQEQVLGLSPVDIATSSPQVQKILRDIKALEKYPKSEAREMCENFCKSL